MTPTAAPFGLLHGHLMVGRIVIRRVISRRRLVVGSLIVWLLELGVGAAHIEFEVWVYLDCWLGSRSKIVLFGSSCLWTWCLTWCGCDGDLRRHALLPDISIRREALVNLDALRPVAYPRCFPRYECLTCCTREMERGWCAQGDLEAEQWQVLSITCGAESGLAVVLRQAT